MVQWQPGWRWWAYRDYSPQGHWKQKASISFTSLLETLDGIPGLSGGGDSQVPGVEGFWGPLLLVPGFACDSQHLSVVGGGAESHCILGTYQDRRAGCSMLIVKCLSLLTVNLVPTLCCCIQSCPEASTVNAGIGRDGEFLAKGGRGWKVRAPSPHRNHEHGAAEFPTSQDLANPSTPASCPNSGLLPLLLGKSCKTAGMTDPWKVMSGSILAAVQSLQGEGSAWKS